MGEKYKVPTMKVYFKINKNKHENMHRVLLGSYDNKYIDAYCQRYVLITVSVDNRDVKGGDDLLLAESVSI